jgi:hypothetical protein
MIRLQLWRSRGAIALLFALLASGSAADKDCGPATPRHDRSEGLVFPETNKVTCHQDRTIAEDSSFFGGKFRSDTGRLTTQYLDGGQVRYSVSLARPGCTTTIQGTAVVSRDRLTAVDGTNRLAFTDGGVDLKLDRGVCAGATEEFFYEQEGLVISEPNDEGSGCDLHILNGNMDKEAFIRFYYAFKRAVAKGDRKAIAGMVSYPLTVSRKKGQIRLKRPSDLVAHYHEVFAGSVLRAISQQKISRLFCRDQGIMFGNGEIWITDPFLGEPYNHGKKDPGPKIIAINVTDFR